MKFKFDTDNLYSRAFRLLGDNFVLNKEISDKPYQIPDCAVREGIYHIRVKGEYHCYEFIKDRNIWVKNPTMQHSEVSLCQWNLYPQLSDNEYQKLESVFKYLSSKWQQNILAWRFSKKLKQITLRARIISMRIKKKRKK